MKIKFLTSVSFVNGKSYKVGDIYNYEDVDNYSEMLKNDFAEIIEDEKEPKAKKSKAKKGSD